jgi:adenine-specific DNA-methyltransferase
MEKPKPRPVAAVRAGPFDGHLAVSSLPATLPQVGWADAARAILPAISTFRVALGTGARGLATLESIGAEAVRVAAEASAAARTALEGDSAPVAEKAFVLGNLYAALLPPEFRARYGIFYTPPALVECLLGMAEDAGVNWTTARVLDPACGGGAFLVGVAARMVRAMEGVEPAIALQSITTRLRGFDLDPFGASLAQLMVEVALRPLASAAGRAVPQLVEIRDSLSLRPDEAESHDLVVGNPPYGRVTLAPERRKLFARSVYGHANLYGVFTEAALHWAKRGGVIAYVTPTSMLSGLYYKALRTLLSYEAPPLAVNFVTDRDGVFANVLQETMLATYRKGGTGFHGTVGFIDTKRDGRQIVMRKRASFTLPQTAHSPWLLPRSPGQAALTKRLSSMPHRLADYGYGVSTGPLVWNRHKDQFRTQPARNAFPVIWAEAVASDGRFIWRSEKRNHAPWFQAHRPKDDWLIVAQPCVLLQRTTAKEQVRRLIAAVLPEGFIHHHHGVVVENHLNMVRPVGSDPGVPVAVIAALLNSATVDLAFRCINGSVAVSAFELEELPLPCPAVMKRIASLVAATQPAWKIEALIATAYGRSDAAGAA